MVPWFNFMDIPGWIKYWFPEFEFTWLAGEMREVGSDFNVHVQS